MLTPMWSLITNYERSSLLMILVVTLATLLVSVPFSLQATDYCDIPLGSLKAQTCYWEGGGEPLSHWSNGLTVCFTPCILGVQPTLWNWDYLLAPSCYKLVLKIHKHVFKKFVKCIKNTYVLKLCKYRIKNMWIWKKQSTRWHYNPKTGNIVGRGGLAPVSIFCI